MSEYNELYQAVQPESPQVVPDEVRFVYIPKAQKGTAGLAWFNEEHFTVSDDSEVSLSATVLGDISKKLDKQTESPTGHGRVYAIYGDGREDPQMMWDLDDTGKYSNYHIPSSDGRGYLKVKDPIEARNPVNKQFLDEKLKGKLDDLGKTSGVFPAAYVRQQGLVVSHDYGKSIEVHGTPDAYTIPVRDAYGALTSASPNSPKDVVTLEYADSHYLKTQPYTPGDGSHSLIFNEIYSNFAFSRDSNVFGENSMVGLWGVKYTAIDTTENSLTIGTISSSPFNVGDRLNIVNDSKYDRSCKFVKYENGKVYVDKLPFTAIVEGDTTFDAYTISSEDNPILGGHYKDGTSNIVDLGKYAFSAGDHNRALNYATFLGGAGNKAFGEYGTAFGRDNEVSYCGFAAGRGNVDSGAHYVTMLGKSHFMSKNADNSTALGSTHSIDAKGVIAGGQNNIASAGANWSSLFGYNNILGENTQYGILLGYGNSGTLSTSDMTSPGGVIAIGENNVISRKWGGAIGRTNTIANFATFGMGLGLTSTKNYQSLFGAFNETDGNVNHMDEAHAVRITGGGSSTNSRMTLEVLTSSGDLHLMGKTLRFDGRGSNPVDLTSVNVGKSNRFWKNASYSDTGTLLIKQNVTVRGLTSFQGTFVATKSAQFNDDVAIAKNLTVAGNFNVTGTTTVTDIKNLAIEDLTITLAKDNLDPLTSMAGLIVPNYMGESSGYTGGLVFDNNGIAYVGDVEVNSNGTVSRGDAKMIMASTMDADHPGTDGGLLAWDASTMTAYTTEFKSDQLLAKQTGTGTGYNLYAYKGNEQTSLSVAEAGTAYTVPRRNSDGVVRGETTVGVTDSYVNVKTAESRYVVKSTDTTSNLVYARLAGVEKTLNISTSPKANAIPQYDANGQLAVQVTDALASNTSAINRDFADERYVRSAPTKDPLYPEQDDGTLIKLYGVVDGQPGLVPLAKDSMPENAGETYIPVVDSKGNLHVTSADYESEDWSMSDMVANLMAVEGIVTSHLNSELSSYLPRPAGTSSTTPIGSIPLFSEWDGDMPVLQWKNSSSSNDGNTVAVRQSNGALAVGNAVAATDAVNQTVLNLKLSAFNNKFVERESVSETEPKIYGYDGGEEAKFTVATAFDSVFDEQKLVFPTAYAVQEKIRVSAMPIPVNSTPFVGAVPMISGYDVAESSITSTQWAKLLRLYQWTIQWQDDSVGQSGEVNFISRSASGDWLTVDRFPIPYSFTVRPALPDQFLYIAASMNQESNTEAIITYYLANTMFGNEASGSTMDTSPITISEVTVTVTEL